MRAAGPVGATGASGAAAVWTALAAACAVLGACGAETAPAPSSGDLVWVKMPDHRLETRPASQRTLLWSGAVGDAATAPCFNRCLALAGCKAFLVDHTRAACFLVDTPQLLWEAAGDAPMQPRDAGTYFERTGLIVDESCAQRAWALEWVPGFELADDVDDADDAEEVEPVHQLQSRAACAQRCLAAAPKCRSARWDSRAGSCRLSRSDRRARPDAFVAAPPGVEYLENQCSGGGDEGGAVCAFRELRDAAPVAADLQVPGLGKAECRTRCLAERSFQCRAFSLRDGSCLLHADAEDPESGSGSGSALTPFPGALYAERKGCIDLAVSCSRVSMSVTLSTPEPFLGRLFAEGGATADGCGVDGRGGTTTTLRLPLAPRSLQDGGRCGLHLATADNRTLASAVVVVQRNPIIQALGDQAVRVGCILANGEEGDDEGAADTNVTLAAAIAVAAPTSPPDLALLGHWPPAPPVTRLLVTDLLGRPALDAQLGDLLQMRLDTAGEGGDGWGARPAHLVASSSDGRDSILLLDERGCPPDPRIFPGLAPHAFRAFKFPSSLLVRFHMRVHFCRGGCAPVDCAAGAKGADGAAARGRRSEERGQQEDIHMQLAIVVHAPGTSVTSGGVSYGAGWLWAGAGALVGSALLLLCFVCVGTRARMAGFT